MNVCNLKGTDESDFTLQVDLKFFIIFFLTHFSIVFGNVHIAFQV